MANSTIKVSASMDFEAISDLVNNLPLGSITTIDFCEVNDINFSVLRNMLRARKKGVSFKIVNVCEKVAERFEDTGVASFVPISRKPKHLDVSKYVEFGASFLSKSYNSDDGDSMIKIYGPRAPKDIVAQEKIVAREVLKFGIPTPLVGTLYETDDSVALDFERIEGKRSFSRIISEEPDRLEEISRLFAVKCKELHSKQCDTAIFNDRTLFYKSAVENCRDITDEEKYKALAFVDSVPKKTTCLHGDMQPSNIIMASGEVMWIDLSDFGYGNPLFDMGMWYFQARMNTEPICQHIYHFGLETIRKVWDVFVDEYYGANTAEKCAEVDRMVVPFAALHMLYLGSMYGFEPHMLPFIRKVLF